MKRITLLFIVQILIGTIIETQAHEYSIKHLGTGNGQLNSYITDITQDKRGNIWIGTESELGRFDGSKFSPYDFNLYHLSDEEKAKLHHLPVRLEDALDALEADHDYLTAGGVFPEELLTNFIKTKRAECSEMSKIPHPAEFDKYYNL